MCAIFYFLGLLSGIAVCWLISLLRHTKTDSEKNNYRDFIDY